MGINVMQTYQVQWKLRYRGVIRTGGDEPIRSDCNHVGSPQLCQIRNLFFNLKLLCNLILRHICAISGYGRRPLSGSFSTIQAADDDKIHVFVA